MSTRGGRPPSQLPNIAGVWRARVVRVDGTGRAYVEVPRLSPGTVYGPCDVLEGPWTPGLESGGANGPDPHDHPAGVALAAGDRVLVVPLEGRGDEVVVLGRLRP